MIPKYKCKNGSELVNLELPNLLSILKVLGEPIDTTQITEIPSGYYLSSSKGLVALKDMNDVHLRNALCQKTVQFFQLLQTQKTLTNKEFCDRFLSFTESQTHFELFTEISKRP